ncbi:MAG: hypothetical protein LBL24_01775 [Bacteroidales bacterium]|jgi:hypothetical protein|nr:hypothetical protein [Bacteroidales bacterium]
MMIKSKLLFVFLGWGFVIPFAHSQNVDHIAGDNSMGGHFVKRIEYNIRSWHDRSHNLDSKGKIEKLFFGDFNAEVEFFYLPSEEAAYGEAYSCFRIVRGASYTSYAFEVKYISNYREAQKKAEEKYPTKGYNLTTEHNKAALSKQNEEALKLYKIEKRIFPVSSQFAEKLYGKMVSFIDNFKAKGVPPIIFDGYSVIFRTVVDDEVWSLDVHEPQGNALKMADLCRQIITDAKANTFEESKYVVR